MAVTPGYPLENDQVTLGIGGRLTPWGYSDTPVTARTLRAWVMKGAVPISGLVDPQPTNGDWSCVILAVPTGNVTLYVQALDDTTSPPTVLDQELVHFRCV